MQFLAALWAIMFGGLDLDEAWRQFKLWLTDEDRKTQRLLSIAGSLIFLALVILLLTNCDGGPQVQP